MSEKIMEIRTHCRPGIFLSRKLNSDGFEITAHGKYTSTWQRTVDTDTDRHFIHKYKRYCFRKQMSCYVSDKCYTRSSGYRDKYLRQKKGLHGWYFCIYCSRPLRKETVTIDHIVPVDKAKRSFLTRAYLRLLHIEDVNAIRNLGACCKKCNRKKSNKLNPYWLIRAGLGKLPFFWIVRWIEYLAILLLFLYGLWYSYPYLAPVLKEILLVLNQIS